MSAPRRPRRRLRLRLLLTLAALGTLAAACGGGSETPLRAATITAVDYGYGDLSAFTATHGEKISFTLTNKGQQPHNIEIQRPDGLRLATSATVAPGQSTTVTVRLSNAGKYAFLCDIGDHYVRGMHGTFTVT